MSEEIAELLQKGIAAARSGDKAAARQFLLEVTDRDERNEQAWLWLSGVVDDPEEARICLENVLAINPHNERAQQGLVWIRRKIAEMRPTPPPMAPAPPPPPPLPGETAAEEAAPEEEKPPANRVPCPACGTLNFDFANECVKCGFPFVTTCPACGELVSTETGLCPNCGADLPLPKKIDAVREREAEIDELYRQGLAYLDEGRYKDARDAFEEVLIQVPGHVEAHYHIGLALAKLAQGQEAKKHWEQVRQIQPDYPGLQEAFDSLLPPGQRKRLEKERKKGEAVPLSKKKKPAQTRPPGQTMLESYEQQQVVEKPVPEEESSGLEAFLYVLIIGLVVGVAYALNRPYPQAGLPPERITLIGKQAGVITGLVLLFWIALGLLSRLLSKVWHGRGQGGAYMTCARHFIVPFFLLIVPIVVGIEQVQALLPETVRQWLTDPLPVPGLGNLPTLPWLVFGGIALFWGLFAYMRGISRVGRFALWKAFLVGIVALLLSLALIGGLAYGGYLVLDSIGHLGTIGFGPLPTLVPTPQVTPSPSPTP